MVANPEKKQPPNKSEEAFIYLARKIYAHNTASLEDEEQRPVPVHLKSTLVALLEGIRDFGEEGFWKAYKTCEKDYPRLKEWRKAIETSPEEEEKPEYCGRMLSTVKPEPVNWLWKPRLALGKMTTFDGDPGLGKSNITLDLASRVSRGRPMPDGTPGIKGGVVLITPEDGLADTIVPRLQRTGADLDRIIDISSVPVDDYERPFTLPDDLPLLARAIEHVQAKLVIIDPVMAVIGGNKDSYRDNEVRSILAPVKMLVEKYQASCIIVRHLTKGGSDNILYRGGGSMAFIGLCRTGLAVARDPQDPTKSVFAHIKTNLGKMAESLNYSIASDEEQGDERPYTVWEGVSTVSANDLLTPPHKNTGNTRQTIATVIKNNSPDEMPLHDIIEAVSEALPEVTENSIRVTLSRMVEKGEVGKSTRGTYHAM